MRGFGSPVRLNRLTCKRRARRFPLRHREYLLEKGVAFHEAEKLDGAIEEADVAYITRGQRKRFALQEEYEAVKNVYIVDAAMAARMKEHAILMHALPLVNEIAPEVDGDARGLLSAGEEWAVCPDGAVAVSSGLVWADAVARMHPCRLLFPGTVV